MSRSEGDKPEQSAQGCGYSPLADEILSTFRACATIQEVNATAVHFADAVRKLEAHPDTRVRAIHIKNMAAYMRRQLKRSNNA